MLKSLLYICASLFVTASVFAEGFVHASGKKVVDGNGNEFLLRGYAPGGWMIQEPYMMELSGFTSSQHEIRAKIQSVLGEENTKEFYRKWIANGFREADVRLLAELGFNSIRLPMHYNLFTLPIEEEPVRGENTWIEEGFELVDSVLTWCRKYQIYLILDMHGAPGGQGKDTNISDYDPSKLSLWESDDNMDKLEALWVRLAERYADEPYIAGYDLINEPNWAFEGDNANGCDECNNTIIWNYYKRLVKAVRQVDKNHMLILEGNCWCNNYNGLPYIRAWDTNLCLEFHKYWSSNTVDAIQFMVNLRNTKNVPVWCGESGENSNHWYADAVRLLEENGIGWAWWTWKKIGAVNGIATVKAPTGYETLKNYWQNGGTKPSRYYATKVLDNLAEAYLLENCTINKAVVDALLRQPHSNEPKPFADNNVPGRIYAPNYDLGQNGVAYLDLDGVEDCRVGGKSTPWNQGWSYRADGVDIQTCKDSYSNGYNVGWTSAGEWMKYTIQVKETAAYALSLRYASDNALTLLRLEVDGASVTPDLKLVSTGGWTTWKSLDIPDVILEEGTHVLKVEFLSGGANISSYSFTAPVATSTVGFKALSATTSGDGKTIHLTLNKELSDEPVNPGDFCVRYDNATMPVASVCRNASNGRVLDITMVHKLYRDNVVTVSYAGNSVKDKEQDALTALEDLSVVNVAEQRQMIPGKVNVEDCCDVYGLSFEDCQDTDGGAKNFGYTDPGDYIDFLVYIRQQGTYSFDYRVASLYGGGQFQIQLFDEDGKKTTVGTYNVNATNGWQTWATQSAKATLPEGTYLLRIYIVKKEFNMNWFSFSNPTDVKGISADLLSVYPNPCNDVLYISSSGMSGGATITISSMAGAEVYRQACTLGGTIAVNVSQLAPGMYLQSVRTDASTYVRKIIVR